jgi:hypothetical protein
LKLALVMAQFTATLICGTPFESVTCTVMGAKGWNGLTNCPSPDTFVMFCADAGWAQKSPARPAARTTTVSLFKISSSFDA